MYNVYVLSSLNNILEFTNSYSSPDEENEFSQTPEFKNREKEMLTYTYLTEKPVFYPLNNSVLQLHN